MGQWSRRRSAQRGVGTELGALRGRQRTHDRRRWHQAANHTSEVSEAGERVRSAWASQKTAVQNAWRSSRRLRGWRRDARRPARRTAAIADDARHQVEGRGQRSTAAGTRSFRTVPPRAGIVVGGLADPDGGSASSQTGLAGHPRREMGGCRGRVWAAVEPPNSNRVLGTR